MAQPVITIHDAAGTLIPPGTPIPFDTAQAGTPTAAVTLRIRNNDAEAIDIDPARNVRIHSQSRLAGSFDPPVAAGNPFQNDSALQSQVVGATGGATAQPTSWRPLGAGHVLDLGEIPGDQSPAAEVEIELRINATVAASLADYEVFLSIETMQSTVGPPFIFELHGNYIDDGVGNPFFSQILSEAGAWATTGGATVDSPSEIRYTLAGVPEVFGGGGTTFDATAGDGPLAVGEEYWAAVSLGAGGVLTQTKGAGAPAGSAVKPDKLAGEIFRLWVLVPETLVITTIEVLPALGFFGLTELGGLNVRIGRGDGWSSGFRVFPQTSTTLSLADDETVTIYVTPQGTLEQVLSGASPVDARSMPLWEVVTSGGAVTSTKDLRIIGQPAPGGAVSADLANYRELFGPDFNASATFRTRNVEGASFAINTTDFRPLRWDDTVNLPTLSPARGDAAVQLAVASTSSNDSSTGTGARSVVIEYIDDNFQEQEVEVLMDAADGQTPVNLPTTGYAVNNARVRDVGATGWQEGDIYIGVGPFVAGVPATTHGSIPFNFLGGTTPTGNMLQTHFATPANRIAAVFGLRPMQAVAMRFALRAWPPNGAPFLIHVGEHRAENDGLFDFRAARGGPLPAETYITLEACSLAGTNQRAFATVGIVTQSL